MEAKRFLVSYQVQGVGMQVRGFDALPEAFHAAIGLATIHALVALYCGDDQLHVWEADRG